MSDRQPRHKNTGREWVYMILFVIVLGALVFAASAYGAARMGG